MSDVDLIVVVAQSHFKGEGVVITTSFFLHRILIVGDIITITVPAYASRAISLFYGINEGLLPLVIAAIRFYEIDNVEPVAYVFFHICDAEVKPLGVVCRLVVIL
jgi:hypothetical protein